MSNMSPKSNNLRRAVYIAAALFVLLALAIGGVYARYAMSIGETAKGSVTSPNFYFSSDLLFVSPETYTLNPGPGGTTSFTFQVRNFVDALRINEKDINVTIAVTSTNAAALEGVLINGYTTAEPITISGNVKNASTVTISGLKNGVSYKITATGTAGFKQTISANVNVKPDEPYVYMHINDADDYYVLLTVWTKNLSGDVAITYPEGLIPDATDPAMATGVYFDTRTFTDETNFQETYSSHVYRFFKTSPGQDIAGGFGASINGKAATNAIPE
jgi:hypothetical protein